MSDDRARQGVEHLQTAALEVIEALRAFLDVAEDLVRDPSNAASLAASLLESAHPPAAQAPGTQIPGDGHEPRVTRIRVS